MSPASLALRYVVILHTPVVLRSSWSAGAGYYLSIGKRFLVV
jgi:hypothetical protein